jgi:hypothetical protein
MHTRTLLNAALAMCFTLPACMGAGDGTSPDSNEEETPAVIAEALVPDAPKADGVLASEIASQTSDTAVARVCRRLMLRQRDCSAVFLPALVAERVRLDNPAGLAAYAAKIGREALMSEALNEYAEDSKDERIAATCTEVASKLPSERAERLVTAGEACLGIDACEPFVACSVPISIP